MAGRMEGSGWSGWRRGRGGVAWLEAVRWLEKSVGRGGCGWNRGGAGVVGGIQVFNSGCFNRGRPDAMLCGGTIIYLFCCLRVQSVAVYIYIYMYIYIYVYVYVSCVEGGVSGGII